MKSFKGKKIILAITADVKLYECFIDNLNLLGFETLLLCDNKQFRYKSILDRMRTYFQKFFLKNKFYKKNLQKSYSTPIFLDILKNSPNDFDYGFFIRPDLFDENIIKLVREKSKKTYAYQWDGLDRFQDVYKTIPLFKKFYVFDKDDLLKKERVSLLNNFYFDCYNEIFNITTPQYDVYYLGRYDNRIDQTLIICEKLNKLGLKLNIIIRGSKSTAKKLKNYPYIKVIEESLSFKDNLIHVSNTKIILDIGHTNLHKGLSFRAFEALGYDKKLITTNTSIKKFDFYKESNIHIYDDGKGLNNFINNDFIDVNPEIKNKYSFSNWIKLALEDNETI